MRKIQRTYMLEPAGSHGVWSLDDHQFLPFFWGSGQLLANAQIAPKSVRSREIVDFYAQDYLYLDAIKFVLSVKTGPFGEHSPTLNSIAELPHWEKVNGGLMKMYVAEVLGKFPVVQHQLFGPIFPFPGQNFDEAPAGDHHTSSSHGHGSHHTSHTSSTSSTSTSS
jgi:serine/threonine-protein phosphatase 2A activator